MRSREFKFTNLHTTRHKLINTIITLNKIAVERFGVRSIEKEELYDIKINDLKNIETELRIQTGTKTRIGSNWY